MLSWGSITFTCCGGGSNSFGTWKVFDVVFNLRCCTSCILDWQLGERSRRFDRFYYCVVINELAAIAEFRTPDNESKMSELLFAQARQRKFSSFMTGIEALHLMQGITFFPVLAASWDGRCLDLDFFTSLTPSPKATSKSLLFGYH